MKKIKFLRNQEKVLVVSGCSHTQGTAYVKKINEPIMQGKAKYYELASDQLKKKYKKELISAKNLAEELTWGGMLAKLLRTDKFFNLGFGGYGIESVIRGIRNYCYKTEDISNHLFVIQIPSSIRKEQIYIDERNDVSKQFITHIAKGAAGDLWGFVPSNPVVVELLTKYYDIHVSEAELMIELHALQKYLEARKAHVRMFVHPFMQLAINDTMLAKKYEKSIDDWINVGLYNELHHPLKYEDLINDINLIDTSELPEFRNKYMADPKKWTLSTDGTLPGDDHYNEQGNYALAQCVKAALNTKLPKVELVEKIEMINDKGEKELKTLI